MEIASALRGFELNNMETEGSGKPSHSPQASEGRSPSGVGAVLSNVLEYLQRSKARQSAKSAQSQESTPLPVKRHTGVFSKHPPAGPALATEPPVPALREEPWAVNTGEEDADLSLAQQVVWLKARLNVTEQACEEARARVEALAARIEAVSSESESFRKQFVEVQQKLLTYERNAQAPAPGGTALATTDQEGFRGRVAQLEELAARADEAEGKIQTLLAQRSKLTSRLKQIEQNYEKAVAAHGAQAAETKALADQCAALRGQLASLDKVAGECRKVVVTIYQHIEFGFEALARSARQSSELA